MTKTIIKEPKKVRLVVVEDRKFKLEFSATCREREADGGSRDFVVLCNGTIFVSDASLVDLGQPKRLF